MPYKNPADATAHRKSYYQENREWEIARVRDWKDNNREQYRVAEAKRKRKIRLRKRQKAQAAELLARAAELAKEALVTRAVGYAGKLNPGRI